MIPVGLPLRQPSITRSARTGPAPRAGRFFVACRQRCPDPPPGQAMEYSNIEAAQARVQLAMKKTSPPSGCGSQ